MSARIMTASIISRSVKPRTLAGVLECWSDRVLIAALLHFSTTPLLRLHLPRAIHIKLDTLRLRATAARPLHCQRDTVDAVKLGPVLLGQLRGCSLLHELHGAISAVDL